MTRNASAGTHDLRFARSESSLATTATNSGPFKSARQQNQTTLLSYGIPGIKCTKDASTVPEKHLIEELASVVFSNT